MWRLLTLGTLTVVLVWFAGYKVWKQLFDTPERRVLREFYRLRRLILEGIPEAERPETENLLDHCKTHLKDLLKADKKIDSLSRMADEVSEITTLQGAPSEIEQLEKTLADDINHFLVQLGEIASQTNSNRDEYVAQLEEFVDQLEERRTAFRELTNETSSQRSNGSASRDNPTGETKTEE